MATCPRCLGALSAGHKCRPIWIRRLRRQIGFSSIGALLGAVVQMLSMNVTYPVLGFILGGVLFFGLHEAFKTE
jgi:hypothetical protein